MLSRLEMDVGAWKREGAVRFREAKKRCGLAISTAFAKSNAAPRQSNDTSYIDSISDYVDSIYDDLWN